MALGEIGIRGLRELLALNVSMYQSPGHVLK